MSYRSLWMDTAVPEPDTESFLGDSRADVVIVGAGYTGLRAALELANSGTDVVVLEAREIGWGASGRNGGQVNPLLPENTPESTVQKLGAEAGEKLYRLAMQSADELFELIRKYNISCGARQNGWIRVAHCRTAEKNWQQECESWARVGVNLEILNHSRLEELTGTSGFSMGALVEAGGAIHPLSLARGLAQAAMSRGAKIFNHTPVQALKRAGSGWTAVTPAGTIHAEHVLLCTNGYTDGLWPGLKNSIVPLTAVQVATYPLTETVSRSILPGGQTLSDTRRTILYGRREPEGQFVLGSIGQGNDGRAVDFKRLRREALKLFPQLESANWSYQWGGRMAVTREHLPHLHEPAPGLTAGLGFNGRGVAMSNVMGRVLAERVLGKAPEDLPIPVTAINSYPLRRFTGIGVPLAIGWMNLRDRLDRMFGSPP